MTRLRTLASTVLATAALLALMAAPAGAKAQPVDATTEGGLAFVLFALMVFIFAGFIFSIDRIRRRRED